MPSLLNLVKNVARKVPGLPNLYRAVRSRITTHESLFTDIYRGNRFEGTDSVSGPGSDLYQTRLIRQELPLLCRNFGVTTLLDIPCGDFYWMSKVALEGVDYTGADVVRELIAQNTRNHGRRNIRFRHLDLLSGRLPRADLVLCRDCLVHFSYSDIRTALDNICRSGSTYLLTTTFTARADNSDIPTGHWRPLTLEKPPFYLPAPLHVLVEGCTQGDGAAADKSLGLWKIDELRRALSA